MVSGADFYSTCNGRLCLKRLVYCSRAGNGEVKAAQRQVSHWTLLQTNLICTHVQIKACQLVQKMVFIKFHVK